jgi:hypothetical protein
MGFSWILLFYFLYIYVIVGLSTGAIAGLIASAILRAKVRRIGTDALLGRFGLFFGFAACIVLFPRNTITRNSGPDPYVIAIITAALLPLLYELYRRFAPSISK